MGGNMLYLIHSDGQGNPVGAWNQNGENFYRPEAGFLRDRGQVIVPKKHPERSWEDWTKSLSTSFNPHNHFHVEDQPEAPLNDVLNKSILGAQFPDADDDGDAGADTDNDGSQ